MNPTTSPVKSASYMLLSAGFFATMGALVKKLTDDFSLFQIIFFRSCIATFILMGLCWYSKTPLLGKNHFLLYLRGFLGFAALVAIFYALHRIHLVDVVVLQQSTPIFVILLGSFLLKEKLSFKSILLVLFALLGILFILKPRNDFYNLGGFAALCGAILAALAYLAIRKLHSTEKTSIISFYFAWISLFLSLIPTLYTWKWPSPLSWLLLTLVGLTGTFGQLALTHSYRFGQASFASPFAYLQLPISFAFGIFWFHEIPDLWSFIGIGITLSACFSLVLSKRG